ncbi:1-phosphofructokinase [Paenibacillus sp. 19GGS1-52]|uniref:1-phosphofructokinase n=1 Tax=Paenibacillus sp. 19GGS1-52 TaxID=2758563 RepID=UPI001EFB91D0|nr:1-phosphofructokinase [Paenibacillus sp. 19GGS1-52]ULO09078.1 1-phosphofructokinase [Paenibacillus sp. 19GGS1-52]
MKKLVITVTLNPALDKTVTIDGLEVGGLNRVNDIRTDAGGKGINVAKVLKGFHEEVSAVGYIGGHNGKLILERLEQEDIRHSFTETLAETRMNLKVVDSNVQVTTEINERGGTVSVPERNLFHESLRLLLEEAYILVLGGSVPPGIESSEYALLIEAARSKGVKTILDADGDALRYGLKAGPDVIKPNIHELEQLVGTTLATEQEIVRAARQLIAEGTHWVIVSMGGEGSVAVSKEEAIRARPFSIKPESTVGAGDSMVAAIASSLIHGRSLTDTLCWATAAGSVTASKPGTQVCGPEEVIARLQDVGITSIEV